LALSAVAKEILNDPCRCKLKARTPARCLRERADSRRIMILTELLILDSVLLLGLMALTNKHRALGSSTGLNSRAISCFNMIQVVLIDEALTVFGRDDSSQCWHRSVCLVVHPSKVASASAPRACACAQNAFYFYLPSRAGRLSPVQVSLRL
jgi:hypothetical protein